MENDVQRKSRTQAKKEAEALQKLGEELTQLSDQQLERMTLPDALRVALMAARSIKANIAGKRHRQFIGALMRDVDPEPIRQALLQANADLPVASEIVTETQMWRDRLLTGDPESMEAFLSACPGLERQRLRQVLRNIRQGKPTANALKKLERFIGNSMEGR